MKIRYDLSATEILKQLGYNKNTGRAALDQLMEEKGICLPKVYQEFMEVAADCPMLETSDLWVGEMVPFVMNPHFFYEEIKEHIEDQKAEWEAHPEKYENSEYRMFDQLPEEQWPLKSSDYLEIGSDYGAGIVTFGIRREDLDKDDPPVYMNHEADSITQWNRPYEKLSDFLLEVVLTALACIDYSTAQEALEENGWTWFDYDEYEMNTEEEDEEEILSEEEWQEQIFQQSGMDLNQVRRVKSAGGQELFLCLEEETGRFYMGVMEEDELALTVIIRDAIEDLDV